MQDSPKQTGAQAVPGRISLDRTGTQDANKDLVQRYVHAVWVEGDLEQARQYVSPDYVYRQSGTGPAEIGDVHGIDGLRRVIDYYRKNLPTTGVRSRRFVIQDDAVVWLFQCTATFKGAVMGIPPTNRPVTWDVAGVYAIRDGKIAEERYFDDFCRAARIE